MWNRDGGGGGRETSDTFDLVHFEQQLSSWCLIRRPLRKPKRFLGNGGKWDSHCGRGSEMSIEQRFEICKFEGLLESALSYRFWFYIIIKVHSNRICKFNLQNLWAVLVRKTFYSTRKKWGVVCNFTSLWCCCCITVLLSKWTVSTWLNSAVDTPYIAFLCVPKATSIIASFFL